MTGGMSGSFSLLKSKELTTEHLKSLDVAQTNARDLTRLLRNLTRTKEDDEIRECLVELQQGMLDLQFQLTDAIEERQHLLHILEEYKQKIVCIQAKSGPIKRKKL
jgi:gamma-glutamyl:cysteine ligase YbdK (ATP-grasp superfamily)